MVDFILNATTWEQKKGNKTKGKCVTSNRINPLWEDESVKAVQKLVKRVPVHVNKRKN